MLCDVTISRFAGCDCSGDSNGNSDSDGDGDIAGDDNGDKAMPELGQSRRPRWGGGKWRLQHSWSADSLLQVDGQHYRYSDKDGDGDGGKNPTHTHAGSVPHSITLFPLQAQEGS